MQLLACLELFSSEIAILVSPAAGAERALQQAENRDGSKVTHYELCFCGRFISELYVYTELAPVDATSRTQSHVHSAYGLLDSGTNSWCGAE